MTSTCVPLNLASNDKLKSMQDQADTSDLYDSSVASLSHSEEELQTDDSELDFETMDKFGGLIADIKRIMGPTSGLDTEDIDTEALMQRMRDYVSNSKEWSKYAFVDTAVNYTRNGVDSINSKANLLVLVWTPGKGSAVHDHANAHCIVKVLQGSLRETLYDTPLPSEPSQLHVSRVSDYGVNEVSYMSDTLGLHRMENVGSIPAVSLHLYTPPYAAKFGCHVFDEASGESKKVSMSTLYSDQGVKIAGNANSC